MKGILGVYNLIAAASGIDEEISCKLGGIHDLVAAEGKYHLKCYASFLRKAKKHSTISQESNDQDTESIGHEEIDDHEVLSDNTINDDVDENIDLNAELLSWLYRVEIKVYHDLKSMPGHDSIGDISQESAEKIIPDSLFTLVKLLCVGHQDDDGEDESSCKTSVLSICQVILFAASRGRDIWVESEIFGETTAGNILRGKLWNHVIRAHKLTYEALWRVLWPIIVAWARDGGHDDEGELAALPVKLAAGFSLEDAIDSPVYRHAVNEMGHVLDIIAQFDEAHQHNPTLCYWRQYMLLVSILLRFTRAIREGDWVLYLSSIAEMLNWFAVFDHVNYFRWVTIFLCDMKALPCNAPEVHKAFIDGDFVTKETCSTFNQIPDNQALEGGLATGINSSPLKKTNEASQISCQLRYQKAMNDTLVVSWL